MGEYTQQDIRKARRTQEEFSQSGFPVQCGIAQVMELMLPMPDGVRLHTVCYLPQAPGPFHTIVQRTCYTIYDLELQTTAEEYCKRGFAYVYQYCRGIGPSEGDWVPNVNEEQDGLCTLDWLCAQDWVEDLGLFGFSYMAFNVWVMVGKLPSKVKTIYVTHYGTDRYTSAYQSGLFRMDLLTGWAMNNAGFPVKADVMESCRYMPHVEVDEALWGGRVDWYRDWVTNTSRSDPYWSSGLWGQLARAPGQLDIPVYIGSGWFDHHLGSTIKAFEALSPQARSAAHFRIGAWSHFFDPCLECYHGDHLENSDVKSALTWFHQILVRHEQPTQKISLYIIGADLWRDFAAYPIPCDYVQKFYLSPSAPDMAQPAHRLTAQPPAEQCSVCFDYDPSDPVPSHGAEAMFVTASEIGSLAQPEPNYRPDVVSFLSDPLDAPLTVVGSLKVRLFASSSAQDTAFTAKIMEVQPDGTGYSIRSSITTLAYRNGDNARGTYTPGEVVPVEINTWDIAWQFQKGSRIRVDISSSDFPQYAIHSNFPGVWSLQKQSQPARQSLFCGEDYPSSLELPCLNL